MSVEEPFSILALEAISNTALVNVRELQAMHDTAQVCGCGCGWWCTGLALGEGTCVLALRSYRPCGSHQPVLRLHTHAAQLFAVLPAKTPARPCQRPGATSMVCSCWPLCLPAYMQ